MGKKVAVAYEDRRKKPKAAECPPVTSGGTYQAKVEACLAKLGRSDPKADVEKSKVYIANAEKAGVDARTTAAIIDATLGHAHLKSPVFTEGAAEGAEDRADYEKAVRAGRHLAQWQIKSERSFRMEHDEAVVFFEKQGFSHAHAEVAAKEYYRTWHEFETGGVYKGAAFESPTRDEWQVIVSNPPAGHRGAILNSVPPGDAYTVGKTIILGGFYDDAEARHVASSITHKYRGSVVTYGPKSTFGVNEAKLGEAWSQYIPYPPAVAKETKEECPCPHGGVPGETPGVMAAEDSHPKTEGSICRPFTRVERDPHAFEMCMKRAAEIGPIDNSKAIYELVAPDVGKLDEEHFFVVMMDFRGQLRDYVRVAQGQRHKVHVDVGDVAAAVLLSKCDGYALVHCHPSGHAEPSKADRQLTKAIQDAIVIVCNHEVTFVDHVVIGNLEWYSFSDKKLHKVKK